MDESRASNPSSGARRHRLALMWRGNSRDPAQPTNHAARLKPLIAALHEAGIETSPVVYFDSQAEAARDALLQADGVMVWINPLQDGQDRSAVDALLREVSEQGVWVSAHPDTILKMGTKDVLYRTRELGWGSDTDLYRTHEEFALRFPAKLAVAGARVLKPLRGNDGQGVLKVELDLGMAKSIRVQAASDDRIETFALADFVERMRASFASDAALIDQAFQLNVGAGMVRCYMSGDLVVGFSKQTPRQTDTSGTPKLGMNSAKAMYGADEGKFQELRKRMEGDWTPGMMRILGLAAADLPAIWDADFLYREPAEVAGGSEHVLCEINVSSVSPFPDVAAPAIAATVASALRARAG